MADQHCVREWLQGTAQPQQQQEQLDHACKTHDIGQTSILGRHADLTLRVCRETSTTPAGTCEISSMTGISEWQGWTP